MRKFAILMLTATLALAVSGQKPKPTPAAAPKATPKATPKPAKTVVPKLGTETEEYEKAKAVADAAQRIAALEQFIKNFPEGAELVRAKGLIVSARAVLAEDRLNAGDTPGAVALFTQALNDAPSPIPDELFTKVILGFPFSLKSRGQIAPAFDLTKLIEEKVATSGPQLLDLAKFYISVQYGTEAIRIAQRSVELDPSNAFAHQTLAIAYRMNFRLDDATASFAKASELNPTSIQTKLNLAEMKRATGKPDEAVAIYRETLVLDTANISARNGLIMSLFESGKRADAEAELKSALESDPNNASLLTGVSYWYASTGDTENASTYSKMALAADQTSVWAYIAEARSLIARKKPLEAERILLSARQFADLPTLDFEIALARLEAGFYREAAEALKRNFAVNSDGLVETYLGNRVLADAKSFSDLLSLERRTIIFNREAAVNARSEERLKTLLELYQKLEKAETPEADITKAADEFIAGDDNARLYRQLFVAQRLMMKKIAPAKVSELMQSAVTGVDAALNVPSPSAALLADELYDSRQYFMARSQVVSVNELPRQKVSAILRGRIEETAGWALMEQKNTPQAIVRFKRALTVLPEKSTWWRSSWKRLGEALLAENNEPEALEAFIRSYDTDQPNKEQRAFINDLWIKVKGSVDGLEARIGADPFATTVAAASPTPAASPERVLDQDVPLPNSSPTPAAASPSPTASVETTPTTTPVPDASVAPTPSPTAVPTPTPAASPEATPAPTPEISPTPEASPSPATETQASPTPAAESSPTPAPSESPTPELTPTPAPSESPTTELTPTPTPAPSESPTPESTPTPAPSESPTTESTPAVTATPAPSATPKPLFDPIIITVGKPSPTPSASPETTPQATPEASPETSPTPETVPSPTPEASPAPTPTPQEVVSPTPVNSPEPTPEASPTPTPETLAVNRPQENTDPTGETRPRVVAKNETPCTLTFTQETVSILNNGGSLGILVGFDDDQHDPKTITATSSSPPDVSVTEDSNLGFSSRRAFFIIKSITEKTGLFSINFSAPCGQKNIEVKVR